MKRTYQNVTKPSTLSSRARAEFLSKDGQLLLPLVELVELVPVRVAGEGPLRPKGLFHCTTTVGGRSSSAT